MVNEQPESTTPPTVTGTSSTVGRVTYSLHEPPLFSRLAPSERVLIAGAGGGFDVYAGLPLFFALRALGKQVHLASLSFSDLVDPDFWVAPGLAEVRAGSDGNDGYFPERVLARWLSAQGIDQPVYAFARTGTLPLRASYLELLRRFDLDAIVLVDGGTDILMRGDEAGIGTPEEDMTSLAALADLEQVPTRLVASLGFGVNAYHGINHTQVLENIAALARAGHYLGALSIPSNSPEAIAYLDAVDDAQRATPGRPEPGQWPDRGRDPRSEW